MGLKQLYTQLPFKWRVQGFTKGKVIKAQCVAYIDARDAMKLLDEVVGQGNWQDEYYESCGLLMCRVGILVDGNWVWKSDTGSESNVEKDKGHVSDAFKRACVKWGIGRFLYDLDIIDINTKDYNGKPKPCDKNGNILWSGADVSEYCMKIYNHYKNK